MKFVIVGLGSIGRRHLKNLIALGEKDIILCRSMLATLPDDELKGFPVEVAIEAALKHKPDAVIISNPTSMHLGAAIPAAAAGCHILLEKPIDNSLDRVPELKKALKKGGGRLLVGFQYRFHPTLKKVKECLSGGRIGRVVSIKSHWGEALISLHPWEDYRKGYAARKDLGGGVVLTFCHPLDYLSWLFGPAEFIQARIDTMGNLDIDVEDVADIILRFPGGALANVHFNYFEKPKRHFLEIIGTDGTILWNEDSGNVKLCSYNGSAPETILPPEGYERNTMFLEQMRHFLSVVRGEAEPLCTLDDGARALEIALKTRE